MLRRWLCALLCGVLCLFQGFRIVCAENALLFPQPTGTATFVRDMMIVDRELFLLTDRLWRYGQGDTEPQPMVGTAEAGGKIACFVRGDDVLSLLYQATGALTTIVRDQVIEQRVLPGWDKVVASDGGNVRIHQAVRVGEILCLLLRNEDESHSFWSADVDAGMVLVAQVRCDIIHIHPYKEGMLLAVTQAENNQRRIVTIDPASGAEKAVLYASLEGEGLIDAAYAAETDTVWVIADQLASSMEAPHQAAVQLGLQRLTEFAWAEIMPTGRLAVLDAGSVGLYALDASAPARVLRIGGGRADTVLASYNLAHPEAPAIWDDRYMSDSETVMREIAGGQGSDVYVLNSSYGFQALAEKGYLSDLSASHDLMAQVRQMYPWAQAALLWNDRLLAFPAGVRMEFWVYHSKAFEEMNEAYPETMDDLLALVTRWEGGLAEQYPEYRLFSGAMDRQMLAEYILRCYVIQYEVPEQRLQLDHRILRTLLARVAEIPFPTASPPSENTQPLIHLAGTPFERNNALRYPYPVVFLPPPAFEAGQSMRVAANMDVYVVNPRSPNQDLALAYIAFAAGRMETGVRYLLHDDLHAPVRDPHVQQKMNELAQRIAEQQAQHDAADARDRLALAEMITENAAVLMSMEAYSWLISQEQLLRYRAIAPHITLNLHSFITIFDAREGAFDQTLWGQITKLLQMYLAGQMSVEAVLSEMDKRIEMAYAEGR